MLLWTVLSIETEFILFTIKFNQIHIFLMSAVHLKASRIYNELKSKLISKYLPHVVIKTFTVDIQQICLTDQ